MFVTSESILQKFEVLRSLCDNAAGSKFFLVCFISVIFHCERRKAIVMITLKTKILKYTSQWQFVTFLFRLELLRHFKMALPAHAMIL